jgi:hypothetical protein
MRHLLRTSLLTVLLAGGGACALAQDATPPAPPAPMAGKPMPMHGDSTDHARHGFHHDFGMMREHGFGGPGSATLADLHALERLYLIAGRAKELPALYNDVLAKSQDPMVREYAHQHLARAQMQPANVDAAIATLRKSLDENLANEAKMHAAHEQMRQTWEQHHDQQPTPPPAQH